MALRLAPLHPLFAAEARGVNLRRPPDAKTKTEIEAYFGQPSTAPARGRERYAPRMVL
jgi:hypothetical protein